MPPRIGTNCSQGLLERFIQRPRTHAHRQIRYAPTGGGVGYAARQTRLRES